MNQSKLENPITLRTETRIKGREEVFVELLNIRLMDNDDDRAPRSRSEFD